MIVVILVCILTWASMLSAAEHEPNTPWETYGVTAGTFFSNLNTSFRLGAGIGLDVDVEELLDLESSSTVFRLGGLWRFSDNKKHRVDLSWFAFHRSGSKAIAQDIEIENKDGDTVTINAGTQVKTEFNIDIYQVVYGYSFLQDDRIDLATCFGLYVMPIDYSIRAVGAANLSGQQEFTAPLPTIGLRLDIALTPKWFFRSGAQLFYLEYEQFRGSLLSSNTAIEYKPCKYFGLGLGVDSFNLSVEAREEDYPSIDLAGNIEFEYIGVQLYARFFF
jgi:hypothetical protein